MIYYLPIAIASLMFIALGVAASRRIRGVADFIPVSKHGGTQVQSSRAFSASTVATSLSLATIVAAYFNLAGFFGLWLLWTAITGALGMLVAYLFSGRISDKLAAYGYRPSIHQFLAQEYSYPPLRRVSASLTVVGLMLLLATELLVGSSFLSSLVSETHGWALTVGIASVAVMYVVLGGFGTVIKTDRVQMLLIWVMIPSIGIAILLAVNPEASLLDNAIRENTFRPVDTGLMWFLVGIALMNIPTPLSSMTVWQRISGSSSRAVVRDGLLRSALGVLGSWGLLVVVAWLATINFEASSGGETFRALLLALQDSRLGPVVTFLLLVGLYSALLSTASTLLVAIGHTLATDVVPRAESAPGGAQMSVLKVRVMILASAIGACGVVVFFEHLGFQVEDMIFSIYGGALALFPPILLALVRGREALAGTGRAAFAAVIIGFLGGWSVAFYGKIGGVQNLVFMSPAIGMAGSAAVLVLLLMAGRSGPAAK